MNRKDYLPKEKESGQGADKQESLQDMERAHAEDPAGVGSIEKAKQKATAEREREAQEVLDDLKKKAAAELAKRATEEALRQMNKKVNMIDVGPFRGLFHDLLTDPMKAARQFACPDGTMILY